MSRAAASHAADSIQRGIERHGLARIVAATGASQIDFLAALTAIPGVDWTRVEMFHLDEYIGLPADHHASFGRYLRDRLIDRVGIHRYHLLDAAGDARASADAVGRDLRERPVDVAFLGIGENGHVAFNDPPADFTADRPYLIVTLDAACRRQQVGEGWFGSIAEVPSQAITMSVRQILRSREIICVVPDSRKAQAVKASVEGEISPLTPASILRTHARTTLYLDGESSALLRPEHRGDIAEV